MPPAVLADSDDDGDNVIELDVPDEPRTSGQHASANEQSTGSTERILKGIRIAERALLAPSAEFTGSMEQSSGSPSVTGQKRRHTAAFDKAPSISPDKRVKRTKTQRTYSNKQRSFPPRVQNEGGFAGLRDDGDALATSRSARFTEHSDANSSGGLPAGSIRADFATHESNVMCRDSGSTAVDNSSSQRRMIQQALSENKKMSTSASKLVDSDEHKSSFFSWTASQQTPFAKTPAMAEEQHLQTVQTDDAVMNAHEPDAGACEKQDEHVVSNHKPLEQAVDARLVESTKEHVNALTDSLTAIQRSSSRVEIALTTLSPAKPAVDSTQKSTRGRKRKTQDNDSEPLDSDDRAVGLPKERYVPRPSRRRTTQALEEPIDFSIKPEKAAKIKRTRTTGGAKAAKSLGAFATAFTYAEGMKDPKAASRANSVKATTKPKEDVNDGRKEDEHQVKEAAAQQLTADKVTTEGMHDLQSPVKQLSDDEIFVKPTPKPKSTARAKRSRTTIFEDHVEFVGSQRSPSLSQQQAKRKTALKGLGYGAAPAAQRKRRTVVEEDDEKEGKDKLAVNAFAEEKETASIDADEAELVQEEAPKKGGRGRPHNKGAGATAESTQAVRDDSEAEAEEAVSEVEEPPKKRGQGRGRPQKASAATLPGLVNGHVLLQTGPTEDEVTQGGGKAVHMLDSTGTGANITSNSAPPAAPGRQEPTPSPEKPSEVKAAVAAATPPKSSPTSHSPLKSSSTVPLRVGLSKRQRIPPLLRTMKPPKR